MRKQNLALIKSKKKVKCHSSSCSKMMNKLTLVNIRIYRNLMRIMRNPIRNLMRNPMRNLILIRNSQHKLKIFLRKLKKKLNL